MRPCYLFGLICITAMFTACEQEPVQPGPDPEPELPKIDAPSLCLKNYNETSFLVEWEAIEGAGGYVYSVDDGQEMTISETFISVQGLETSAHILKVKAVSNVPQMSDSDYSEMTINLGHKTDPNVEKWLGTWKATFSQTLKWTDPETGEEEAQLMEDDYEVELTITENPEISNGVMITGWYPPLPETPAYGIVMPDGTIQLDNGVSAGDNTGEGTPTWMSFCASGDSFGFVSSTDMNPYTLSLKEEASAFGSTYSGVLADGRQFKVVNIGIYYNKGNGMIGIPYDETSYTLPAGSVQMNR